MVLELFCCRKDRQLKVSARWYSNHEALVHPNPTIQLPRGEREALAIRWGIKKLRKYLLGAQQFKVITDHKPLQAMFNKTAGDLPPRIEKFIMDVQEYEYVVEYHPGKTNIADYLSRHPQTYAISSSVQAADEFARTVVQAERVMLINSNAAVTIQVIREETRKNTTLMKLIHTIQTGLNEADEELLPYMAEEVKHDLHIIDGVIYRRKRLIVPETLQRRVIAFGHEGHQGISKTKSFIRQFCWFPGLDAKVERQIKECLACRATQPSRYHEPIKASELPKGPCMAIRRNGFPRAIPQWGIHIRDDRQIQSLA